MSKISNSTDFDRIPQVDQIRYISIAMNQVRQILNNGFSFDDNFDGQILNVTFTAANSDTFTAHDLNRVTANYIVFSLSANMVIYNGATANTNSGSYFRSSAVGTAKLLIF